MLKPLSIYFHWPYCKSKCPYCDFFKRVQKNVPQQQIIDSYGDALEKYHAQIPDRRIRSVFFGGGTPSLIEPRHIGHLLDKIADLWPCEDNVEVSLEANPNSEYPDMFKNLRLAGVNRLSLGVQALNDSDLKFLGRTHNLQQALHSIEQVLKHFDNHSMDLIYARPQQTFEQWGTELEKAVSFGFKHLSLYQLTIEEGTTFAAKKITPLDEDSAADMYRQTTDFLCRHGYPRYEVSNYAPPNFESAHNKCYWQGDDYIGIGESAHGRLKIGAKHFAIEHPFLMQELSNAERAEELIIMGMRLQKGINKAHFEQICDLKFDSFINRKAADELIKNNLCFENSNRFGATENGFLLLNLLIEKLCLF